MTTPSRPSRREASGTGSPPGRSKPPASPAASAPSASAPAGPSNVGSSLGGSGERERFATDELAIILSHFDIGVIESIQDFPRGSRKAPKLLIRTDTGVYLLKRRARGKDDAFKVAFCHNLQLFLAQRQFPLPHLIGTRRDNNSMLQWRGAIYELFEFIKGVGYDQSLEATADSGKILALFHKLLKDFEPDYDPPKGSYHASSQVAMSFNQIPRTLAKTRPEVVEGELGKLLQEAINSLRSSYDRATKEAEQTGMSQWPVQIVHSDWHPGNMLFRGPRVVAVIDYDTSRLQQRVLDIANGTLQFSMVTGGDDLETWPDFADESRIKRFLRGYDAVPGCVLSKGELRIIPWLMIEALVAECVIPIANSGRIGRLDGFSFLRMVLRKVAWLEQRAEALAGILGE